MPSPGPEAGGRADAPSVVPMMTVTGVLKAFVVGGLKLQVDPAGNPVQARVSVPSPGVESISMITEVTPPATTCALLLPSGDIWIGGPICVGSLAVWLFRSLPPETVAELTTLAWIFCGTVTVRVIAG